MENKTDIKGLAHCLEILIKTDACYLLVDQFIKVAMVKHCRGGRGWSLPPAVMRVFSRLRDNRPPDSRYEEESVWEERFRDWCQDAMDRLKESGAANYQGGDDDVSAAAYISRVVFSTCVDGLRSLGTTKARAESTAKSIVTGGDLENLEPGEIQEYRISAPEKDMATDVENKDLARAAMDLLVQMEHSNKRAIRRQALAFRMHIQDMDYEEIMRMDAYRELCRPSTLESDEKLYALVRKDVERGQELLVDLYKEVHGVGNEDD